MVLLLTFAGCQTVEESGQVSKAKRLAMVSHFDSRYSISASKNSFSWKPDSSFILASENIKPDTFKPVIENAIILALQNKGYQFTKESNTDLQVSYAAGLEAELSDKDIVKRFGMNPGLQGKSSKLDQYEKGTIIVDILDTSTNKSVWRGVVQGYADMNLSRAERGKRMESIMQQLLAEFPAIL